MLGETLYTQGPAAFVLASAVALVIIATVALARGEAASIVAETGRDVPRPVPAEDAAPPEVPPAATVSPPAPEGSPTIT